MEAYLQRMKDLLNKSELTPLEVRDGIIAGYLIISRMNQLHGNAAAGLKQDPEGLAAHIQGFMSAVFWERGFDFNHPTVDQITEIKMMMDGMAQTYAMPENLQTALNEIYTCLIDRSNGIKVGVSANLQNQLNMAQAEATASGSAVTDSTGVWEDLPAAPELTPPPESAPVPKDAPRPRRSEWALDLTPEPEAPAAAAGTSNDWSFELPPEVQAAEGQGTAPEPLMMEMPPAAAAPAKPKRSRKKAAAIPGGEEGIKSETPKLSKPPKAPRKPSPKKQETRIDLNSIQVPDNYMSDSAVPGEVFDPQASPIELPSLENGSDIYGGKDIQTSAPMPETSGSGPEAFAGQSASLEREPDTITSYSQAMESLPMVESSPSEWNEIPAKIAGSDPAAAYPQNNFSTDPAQTHHQSSRVVLAEDAVVGEPAKSGSGLTRGMLFLLAGLLLGGGAAYFWFGVVVQGRNETRLKAMEQKVQEAEKQLAGSRQKLEQLQTLVEQQQKAAQQKPRTPEYLKTSSRVLLYWENGNPAGKYNVYRGKGKTGEWKKVNTDPVKACVFFLKNTPPGTWRFSVAGLDFKGEETTKSEAVLLKFPLK